MEIVKLNHQKSSDHFDINMIEVLPKDKLEKIPFRADYGTIKPKQMTTKHRHDEREVFFIISGNGLVESEGVIVGVESGDVIHFNPFESHTLTNTGTRDLSFLTMYWRDYKKAIETASNRLNQTLQTTDAIYITSGPPTPNGDLHLGHIAGPCLGADVCTRYLKMSGREAYNISWSDDYQSSVVTKSKQLGLTPEQTADKFATDIKLTLDNMKIELDLYVRPLHSKEYQEDFANFFYMLWKQNIFSEERTLAFFDKETKAYVNEGNIKGNCPHCREKSSGNICEECGYPNSCVDMIEPTTTSSNTKPIAQPTLRLHFPLNRYVDQLKNHHDDSVMRSRLRVLFNQMSAEGLLNFVVSHPSNWGISVPLDHFKNHTISAWFEMSFAFLFCIREIERRKNIAEKDISIPQNARIVHFFGYDNAFYYTTLFPSVYLAAFPNSKLKIDYVCNEFYLLDELKFSTSKEHAIWAHQLLKEVPADEIRFYLAYTRPETSRTNFTKKDFYEAIESELAGRWRTWLITLNDKVKSKFNGKVPEAGLWTHEHRNFFGRLQCFIKGTKEAYEIETFSLQKACRLLCELVRETTNFANEEKHWSNAPNCEAEYRTAITIEITAARLLALLAAPLMPDFSIKLWNMLGGIETYGELKWPEIPPFAVPDTEINLNNPPIRCTYI